MGVTARGRRFESQRQVGKQREGKKPSRKSCHDGHQTVPGNVLLPAAFITEKGRAKLHLALRHDKL